MLNYAMVINFMSMQDSRDLKPANVFSGNIIIFPIQMLFQIIG